MRVKGSLVLSLTLVAGQLWQHVQIRPEKNNRPFSELTPEDAQEQSSSPCQKSPHLLVAP